MKKIFSGILNFVLNIPTYICCALIRFYQIVISPVIHIFGGGCRFFPTCSQYTLLCIKHHGAIKGIIMGACRIIRCNPLSKGGLDFPPKKFDFKKLFSQNSVDEFNDFDNKP
ncbi:MAG: membrane protein insertion efficiency factor YidD [Verrucomicrobiaceae bacterium]|jgi:putative membrane protein insertion efficiency factor|nr:membrane protein insertion efficiency factor YidD [Verrucomicrobiaceae bacterium]